MHLGPEKRNAVDQLRTAKIEETNQRARVLRLQADREDKRLCDLDEVKSYYGRVLGGLRVQLTELGPNLAPRVNPADPVLAASIIDEAVHAILQTASEQVERHLPASTRRPGVRGTKPGEMVRAR